jgi:hypothetical protein
MSNFDFLKSHSQEWAKWGAQAEEYLCTDPSSCVTKLRALAEAIAEEVFKTKGLTIKPDISGQVRYGFAGYIGAIKEAQIAPKEVLDAFYAIKENGNEGAHKQTANMESAERALRAAHALAYWFMSAFRGKRLIIPSFVVPKPPKVASSPAPGSSSGEAASVNSTNPSSDNTNANVPPHAFAGEQTSAYKNEQSTAGQGRPDERASSSTGQSAVFGKSRAIPGLNFEFLRPYNKTLADLGGEAEGLLASSFPGAAGARFRLFAESVAKAMARKLGLHVGLNTSFLECIQALDARLVRNHEIAEALDVIRQLGNVETHNYLRCAGIASEMMERNHFVASWYVKTLIDSSASIPEYVPPLAQPLEEVPAWKKFLGTKQGKWTGAIVGVLAAIFGWIIVTDTEHRWDRALRQTLKSAAFILLLVLIALPFFVLANGVTIWGAYNLFVTSVSSQLRWDERLIHVLAIALLLPFFYSLRQCISLVPWRRWIGITVLLVLAIGYNLMLYYGSPDGPFGPDGHRLIYYAYTDQGIVTYPRPGIEPTTGQPLLPMTAEVWRIYQIQLKLGVEAMRRPVDPAAHDWFSVRGAPILWYSGTSLVNWEFFLLPGVNPRTDDQLLPVTRELEQRWSEARAPKPPKPVPSPDILINVLGPAAPGEPGVLLVRQNANDNQGADALGSHLSGVNTSAIRSDALERRGLASRFYRGDAGLLREALSRTQLRSLVVAEVTIKCGKRSSLDADLLSCDMTANARKYDSRGNPAGAQVVQSTGAGFNQDSALDAAAQRASSNLSAFAKQ